MRGGHGIANVTFEGLEISGKTIASTEEADLCLGHVKELHFRPRPGFRWPNMHEQ